MDALIEKEWPEAGSPPQQPIIERRPDRLLKKSAQAENRSAWVSPL